MGATDQPTYMHNLTTGMRKPNRNVVTNQTMMSDDKITNMYKVLLLNQPSAKLPAS